MFVLLYIWRLLSFVIFKLKVAHWIQNDYTYYENKAMEINNRNNDPQPWYTVFYDLKPRTTADKKVFACIILEIIALSLNASSAYYSDSDRISTMVPFWMGIIWLTMTCSIRYIHTFYKWDRSMIFQIIILVILVIILFTSIYFYRDDYDEYWFHCFIGATLIYIASICILLGFYIFVDMNFELTLNFMVLEIAAAVIIASWSIFYFAMTKFYKYLLIFFMVILILSYLVFLYSRWKRNE